MPSLVSDFLDLENKVGRRFREDSVTDIIISSLLRIVGANATVLVPPEVKTGGDFDILIVEPSTGDAVQYRIQAKRLSTHPTTWAWSSYRELDYPHGLGKQSSTLIRSSAKEKIKTIPLYAFYNPEAACLASRGAITGIDLADGRQINEIVKSIVKAKAASKRPRLKRVGYLHQLFFPFSSILCSYDTSRDDATKGVVSPRASEQSVRAAIQSRARPEWMEVEGVPTVRSVVRLRPSLQNKRKTRPPGVHHEIEAGMRLPALIERAINRGDEQPIRTARIKRPKIILVSRG